MSEQKSIPDLVREQRFTTKDDLIQWIEELQSKLKEQSETDMLHSAGYYYWYDLLLSNMLDKVKRTRFFNRLEDYWHYTLSVGDSGIRIYLRHLNEDAFVNDSGRVVGSSDESFLLLQEKAKLLSIEEYASTYGVEPGTVRQWIRRGKIRNAEKIGSEWRIPVLSEMPGRSGYKPAYYQWFNGIHNLPEQFAFLKDYVFVGFFRDENDKKHYLVRFVPQNGDLHEEKYTEREREKLELFLIAHPEVQYVGISESGFACEVEEKDYTL